MIHQLENACRVMERQLCWYVSIGGTSSPSFLLVLGERVPRVKRLDNAKHAAEFRDFRGSVELLVWCSWRLQHNANVVASSAQSPLDTAAIERLIGASVVAVRCSPPAWDLVVDFSDGSSLAVFCDHVDPGSPISENWELWTTERCVAAGPGSRLIAEHDD